MIRDPETPENMRITVELEDGTKHERCDTTSQPFGQEGIRVIAVWVGDEIEVFPLERVKSLILHWD
jgi:hypothetical protein